MKALKKHSLYLFTILSICLGFTSCSDDNEDGADNGNTIIVNDETLKIGEAVFSDRNWLLFNADIWRNENNIDGYDFTLYAYNTDFNKLKVGDVLDITVRSYRPFNSVSDDRLYYDTIGGKVTVETISPSSITLKIENLSFTRKEVPYKINGIITYERE